MSSFASPFAYFFSTPEFSANIIMFSKILVALILGLFVGYERAFHGRAAGMRTFGLVCMASAALTVIGGYSNIWYAGRAFGLGSVDPTRIVQGIVTGIGFLGAGIIMKDGYSISGLTTAAAIWAASAIGVLIGLDFYVAGILLALLSTALMMLGTKMESFLPSHPAIAIILEFTAGFTPSEQGIQSFLKNNDYQLAKGTISISRQGHKEEWRFVAISLKKETATSLANLSKAISVFEGIDSFKLSHARN